MRAYRSLPACLALCVLWCAAPARAESARVLVAIGANWGDPDDEPLSFAERDAESVRELFVEIGNVLPERAYLVLNRPAATVREKLAEVSGRIAELTASGKEVVLIVYVSAHARNGVIHLSGTHLPLAELRDYAHQSHASLRLVVVDACDSGAIARGKGGVPGAEYQVVLDQTPLSGQVLISSSGPAEVSQELDALGGSLFTHHLLTGLRGDADADGDGAVTLSEAYSYAYRRTVLDAEGAPQHPAFDFDLHGAGDWVLSRPGAAGSVLLFPESLAGHYVVASQPRPDIFAELDKAAGKPLRFAVAPGRYLVRKRLGRRVGLETLEMPYGGQQTVDDRSMIWRDYLEIGFKGGYVETHASAALALGSAESAPLDGTGARWRAGAGFHFAPADWWTLAAVTVGSSHYRAVAMRTSEISGALSLAVGYRWLELPVTPVLGLAADLVGYHQSYRRDDEARIRRVLGQPGLPTRTSLGIGAGPVAGAELTFGRQLFGLLLVKGELRYLPADLQTAVNFGVEGSLAVGWRL
jgi:hypothetical protein